MVHGAKIGRSCKIASTQINKKCYRARKLVVHVNSRVKDEGWLQKIKKIEIFKNEIFKKIKIFKKIEIFKKSKIFKK